MAVGQEYIDKEMEKLERDLAREYRQAKKEMQEKLDRHMKSFKALDAKKQAQVAKGKLDQKSYDKWRKSQLFHSKWIKNMIKSYSDLQVETNKRAAEIINKGLPSIFDESFLSETFDVSKQIGIDFALHNDNAISQLVKRRNELLPKSSIDIPKDRQWNQRKMRSALTQGVLQGESVDKIAKRLSDVTDMNGRAALRNARTMTNAAQNAGHLESYYQAEAMGTPVEKMWQAALDGRTRDSHRHLDGVQIPLRARFDNGLMYPGDPDGAPGEVYNCRCRLSCQILGFERDVSNLANRNTDHFIWDSYEDWKAAHALGAADNEWEPTVKRINAKEYDDEWHLENSFSESKFHKLPAEQSRAVRAYTGSDYRSMNGLLRGRDVFDPDEARILVNNCTKALEQFELKEDVILYRGLGETMHLANALGIDERQLTDMVNDGSIAGQMFAEKGFVSTGISKTSGWDKEVELTILAPKGTKGLYVDPVSKFAGEKELLLQQGTKYEILEATETYDGYHLTVQVVEQNPVEL